MVFNDVMAVLYNLRLIAANKCKIDG